MQKIKNYNIENHIIKLHNTYHQIETFQAQDIDFNELNVFGLSNLGNTTYFIYTLQCILNCRYFTNVIINDNNSIEKREQ